MMVHAERCPVCSGAGKVKRWNQFEIQMTTAQEIFDICHGCYGRGWITVGVEYPKFNVELNESIDKARNAMKKGGPYLSHKDIFSNKKDYSPLLNSDPTEEF